MGLEIERKFLLADASWRSETNEGTLLVQGYLSTIPERTVRVRVRGQQGTLTVKGKNENATRQEFEYDIPVADALAMLKLCEQPIIEKTRYEIFFAGKCWEIDEFSGVNTGLIVAEVELNAETEAIELPRWIGREVTTEERYYNSNLLAHPFQKW
ncbi:MAG: CYTH domain-containing protein [Saprospiraceae bacterium]